MQQLGRDYNYLEERKIKTYHKKKAFDVEMCIICQIDGSQTVRMGASVMP